MKKGEVTRNELHFLFGFVVFLAVSLPFVQYLHVGHYTEVRPAAAFPPVFGLLFGFWSALGCATANLVCDYFVSGYSPAVCFWGFWLQLLFGTLPIYLWRYLKGGKLKFNHSDRFIKFVAVITVNGLVNTVLCAFMLHVLAGIGLISVTTMTILFNNVVMGLLLGIPIILLYSFIMDKLNHRKRSINERFTWELLIFGLLSADMVGVAVYLVEHYKTNDDLFYLWKTVYFFSGIDLFVFILAIYFVLRLIERRVTVPLEMITDVAKEFIGSSKDADACHAIAEKCEPLTKNDGEIGYLAKTVKNLVINIDNSIDELVQVSAEKERIKLELSIATKIQNNMLPSIFPPYPSRTDIDLYASMTPAKEVGGDFYDFYFTDENTLVLLIADVSGKGIPAAMFMMTAKTMIKSLAETGIPVDEVFNQVNAKLCEVNEAGMFVTAWMGEIDLRTGVLSYVNAGHNPPLIKKGCGNYEFLKARRGLVLAGLEGVSYRKNEVQLMPGDRLFLYTDGVTEAVNGDGQMYSENRLLETVNSCGQAKSQTVCERIRQSVDDFVGGEEQFDDMTMLAYGLVELDAYNTLTVIPSVASIARVTEFVDGWLHKTKVTQSYINKINIAIDEIYSNIAYYSQANWASVHYERDLNHIYLTFMDDGKPYDPLGAEEPDTSLSAEEREIGGLGLFLVKNIMDQVEYEYKDNRNILRLTKKV